jgi:hypothetical protein
MRFEAKKGTGRRARAMRLGAALCVLAVLGVVPVLALAHGAFDARAKKPSFDSSSLRLVGVGGYGTSRAHSQIRVTACLTKRYRGQFYNISCETNYSTRQRVKANVSVPGCVRGVWKTTALGQAQGRSGAWTHDAYDVSPPFRCP